MVQGFWVVGLSTELQIEGFLADRGLLRGAILGFMWLKYLSVLWRRVVIRNVVGARINPTTVNTLTWLAVLLLLVGAMIPSPLGLVAIAGLGGVVVLVPIVFGSMKFRIAGLAVLLVAFELTTNAYPDAKQEMARYSAHARSK